MMKKGTHVRLKANDEEGWEEEYGIVLNVAKNRTLLVEVDGEYKVDEYDDCLRDVRPDDAEEVRR